MADRNLSALENYNFELVDGVKLKKDKLNSQNSYSEAWGTNQLEDTSPQGGGLEKNKQTDGTLPLEIWLWGSENQWEENWDWAVLFSGAAVNRTYQ